METLTTPKRVIPNGLISSLFLSSQIRKQGLLSQIDTYLPAVQKIRATEAETRALFNPPPLTRKYNFDESLVINF